MAKVLVLGGAGYVGGTACAWLKDRGHEVWIIDDLSTGRRDLLHCDRFVEAGIADRDRVAPALEEGRFDCVMHFAAKTLVSESVRLPELYFHNNVEQTRSFLEMACEAGVRRFIFSSTCAVFGDPGDERIHERLPHRPMNPYGESKSRAEEVFLRFTADRGAQAIALRYFNAAGAEPGLRVGECHEPEFHLIPNVLKAAREGRAVDLFGTDYPTPDGSCVRDYVHVWDLARAHEASMERLLAKQSGQGSFESYNLGSETGYSVREVIRACEKVVGRAIQVREMPRRPGDPPKLVADSALARRELGFRPEHGLERIISSAWEWEKRRG